MINGAHAIIYTTDADADRAFLRDVIGLPSIDSGGGWLIFGLPASEIAVHPAEASGRHEIYFLVKDVKAFIAAMRLKQVRTAPVRTLSWGLLTEVNLPGGGKIGVYEPLHARPPAPGAKRTAAPKRKAKAAARATVKRAKR